MPHRVVQSHERQVKATKLGTDVETNLKELGYGG
jgi:hypothetical protein